MGKDVAHGRGHTGVIDARCHDDGFAVFVVRCLGDPSRDVSRQDLEARGGDPVVVGYKDSHMAYDNGSGSRAPIFQQFCYLQTYWADLCIRKWHKKTPAVAHSDIAFTQQRIKSGHSFFSRDTKASCITQRLKSESAPGPGSVVDRKSTRLNS